MHQLSLNEIRNTKTYNAFFNQKKCYYLNDNILFNLTSLSNSSFRQFCVSILKEIFNIKQSSNLLFEYKGNVLEFKCARYNNATNSFVWSINSTNYLFDYIIFCHLNKEGLHFKILTTEDFDFCINTKRISTRNNKNKVKYLTDNLLLNNIGVNLSNNLDLETFLH